MSIVNDKNAKSESISDKDICALFGSQSIAQIVDYFRPVMRTVLKEVHMLPDWDTGHLAETLGVKEQDLADILECKSTNNELSCMLQILASLKWAATHSTLFSGVQKYLLPYNNGNSKLEFLNNSRSIKVFVTSNFPVEPFEILKIYLKCFTNGGFCTE